MFDRFDICEAWHCFLANYHGGQSSPEYSRLCKMDAFYKPSPMQPSVPRKGTNARAIYRNLVRRYQLDGWRPHG